MHIGYSFAVLAEVTFEILSLYWIQKKHLVLSVKLGCGGFELKYPVFHCRHLFHKSCVDPWLLDHRTCPMCKMNILKALGIPVSTRRAAAWGRRGTPATWMYPQPFACLFSSSSSCHVIDLFIDLLREEQAEIFDSTFLLHPTSISKEECLYGGQLGVGICGSGCLLCGAEDCLLVFWWIYRFFQMAFVCVLNRNWIYFFNHALNSNLKAEGLQIKFSLLY